MLLSNTEGFYKKIKDAINRNDFKSAKHMLDKYQEHLSPGAVAELSDMLEKKQKKRIKKSKRTQNERIPINIWCSILGKDGIVFALILVFIALGVINFPYLGTYYNYVRSGIGNPTRKLFNDVIILLMLLDASVLSGMLSITPTFRGEGDGKGYKWACLICFGLFLFKGFKTITYQY